MIIDRVRLDRLYLLLGRFTSLYLLAVIIDFFTNLHTLYPAIDQILEALTEPYIAALGIYVVLKEIRRSQHDKLSFHRGEFFVLAWAVLLIVSTCAIVFTSRYEFDTTYRAIISSSITSLIIYIGSRFSRGKL